VCRSFSCVHREVVLLADTHLVDMSHEEVVPAISRCSWRSKSPVHGEVAWVMDGLLRQCDTPG
jgi:hypothetical protein